MHSSLALYCVADIGRSIIKHFVSQYVFYSAGNCGIYLYDAWPSCNPRNNATCPALGTGYSALGTCIVHCNSQWCIGFCTFCTVVSCGLFQKHCHTC